jgi:beta-galactosidase
LGSQDLHKYFACNCKICSSVFFYPFSAVFQITPTNSRISRPVSSRQDAPTELAGFLSAPEITSYNRLPSRATFNHHATRRAAQKGGRENAWEMSLDGTWDFRLASTPEEALSQLGFSGKWAHQTVPGHWVLQGYGRPHYTNTQLPFDDEPPRPPADNPTGIYRRRFEVPETWSGKRVVLRFGSADSALLLFVNGEFVGLSKDSRLPAEFDLTSRLRVGENEVVAVVPKWCDASYLEDQDMWWLPGLARSVTLYATPRVYLGDIKAEAIVSRSGRGSLRVQVEVGYQDGPVEGSSIEVQLYDGSGRVVFPKPLTAVVESRNLRVIIGRHIGFVEAAIPQARLKLWSPEMPHLYTVVVTLKGAESVSHTSVRVGFRHIEIVGQDFLLNGQRVLITGVNRHEFHPRRGRALTEADMLQDVKLMKLHHFNAVRASHYPPDERWLNLCDEYGLMVVDEANIEAHHHHNQVCNDPRYAVAFVDRVSRMVLRDKNHPSVIWWSMGNESGHGPNHDAAAGWVRHYDPTRPLFYEGAISVRQSQSTFAHGAMTTDVICPMYTSIEDLRTWAGYVASLEVGPDQFDGERVLRDVEALNPQLTSPLPRGPLQRLPDPRLRPVILCEYSHAMGNSNGSLSDYFELFRTVPGMQGGFIWEWCDHGLFQTLPDGTERLAYGGDFGDVPNDANFCCDGLVSAEREPHPAMAEHRKLAQLISIEAITLRRGKLRVHNQQSFRSIEWLNGEYRWEADGRLVADGKLPSLRAEAGESVDITVPVPAVKLTKGADELVLTIVFRLAKATAWAAAGTEFAWEQFAMELKPPASAGVATRGTPPPFAVDGGDWVITQNSSESRVSRESGAWHSFLRCGKNLLTRPPELSLWRAPTDNDGIKLWHGQEDKALSRWRQFGLDNLQRRVDSVKLVRRAHAVVVETKVALTGRDAWTDFTATERLVFEADSVALELDLRIGDAALYDLPRIGFILGLAEDFEQVEWYGLGPEETYSDRLAAGRLGRWKSTVDAMEVPYVMPQENGHREDVRWVRLRNALGGAIQLSASSRFGFNASRFTADDLYGARHREELIRRRETVVYLDGFHRGVGTGSCGPDTLAHYCWSAKRARFAFKLEVGE